MPEKSLGARECMEVNAAKLLGQHGDDPDNVDVAILIPGPGSWFWKGLSPRAASR